MPDQQQIDAAIDKAWQYFNGFSSGEMIHLANQAKATLRAELGLLDAVPDPKIGTPLIKEVIGEKDNDPV